jgi:hypothetical protein
VRLVRWIAAIALFAVGVGLVIWAKHFDGWDQAWRLDAGVAVGLLAPLYFAEELLREHVKALSRTASESATSYGLLRRLLPAGDERTAVLDALAEGVRAHASADGLSSSDIEALSSGDSEMRAIALAAMRGRPDLIVQAAVVKSIADSQSGFEQYHALKLADEAWSALSEPTRRGVLAAIERDRSGYIKDDASRADVAAAIRRKAGVAT